MAEKSNLLTIHRVQGLIIEANQCHYAEQEEVPMVRRRLLEFELFGLPELSRDIVIEKEQNCDYECRDNGGENMPSFEVIELLKCVP